MATLKTGNWDFDGNGHPGMLSIGSIDAQGNLGTNSTVYGEKITGFWNEASKTLTFMRINPDTSNPSKHQVYTGYLLDGEDILAGSFEGFQGTGGTAQRNVCGWTAKKH